MNVQPEERTEWEAYSAEKAFEWIEEVYDFQKRQDLYQEAIESLGVHSVHDINTWDVIWDFSEFMKPIEEQGTVGTSSAGPYLPEWQKSPLIPITTVNK